MFQWYQQTETRFNKNNIWINLKYRHINGGNKSSVCVCERACMRVCECMRALVCARSCVHACARVFLCLNKGKGMWAQRACACVYYQNIVCPVKYLEIQLNYITAISLAQERNVLQPRVICVIIKLVCYSRLQKRGWLVKGICWMLL